MTELPRVFLSHNSKDKEWVRAPAEALAIELDADSFLDERSIQLGERWDEQIQEAIERCPLALVLLGANGWGPVHRVEALMALERARRDASFRFIPVLLPGAKFEDQESFADGKVFDEIHRMDLSGLGSPSQLADPESESLIAGLRLILTGRPRVDTRELTPFLLRRDAMRWDNANRPAKLLYADARLEEAAQLLARMGELGIPVMREYVETGRQARERRQKMQLGGAILLAAALLVLSLIAYQQTLNARARARAAEALTNPHRYAGLRAAMHLSKESKTAEALAAPFALLADTGAAARIFHGSTYPIVSLAVDAETVFAGTNNGEVWRWQGSSGRKIAKLDAAVAVLQPCGDGLIAAGANGDLYRLRNGDTDRIWAGSAKPSADGYGEVAKDSGKPGANQVTAALQFEPGRALVFDLSGIAWWIDCSAATFRVAGSVPFNQVRHVQQAGDRVLGATRMAIFSFGARKATNSTDVCNYACAHRGFNGVVRAWSTRLTASATFIVGTLRHRPRKPSRRLAPPRCERSSTPIRRPCG